MLKTISKSNLVIPMLLATMVIITVLFAIFTTQAIGSAQAANAMPTPQILHLENTWLDVNGVKALCVRCDVISPLAVTPVPVLEAPK
jgi:hypothetical protein